MGKWPLGVFFFLFWLNDSYLEFYNPKCCSQPSHVKGTSMRRAVKKKVCAFDKDLECSCVTAVAMKLAFLLQ